MNPPPDLANWGSVNVKTLDVKGDDGGVRISNGGVSLNPPPDLADWGSGNVKTPDVKGDGVRISNGWRESGVVRRNQVSKQPSVRRSNLENCAAVSAASESSETSSQIEKPLLKVVC